MEKPLMYGDPTAEVQRLEELDAIEADGWDWSYVPGYSEKKRINDLLKGLRDQNIKPIQRTAIIKSLDRLGYDPRRDGVQPLEIPRLQWIRVSDVRGRDVAARDMQEWLGRLGYRFVTRANLETWGFGFPPAGHDDGGDLIRREDLALAAVSPEIAERNRQRDEQHRREFHAMAPVGEKERISDLLTRETETSGTVELALGDPFE
ncbi:MAG: hypothetical protein R3268_00770 [Acidiferrobacterales bacterium]|nr:hypothetical protein [Acidiferrobacterales bacterium]